MSTEVGSPVAGLTTPLSDVPDPVFSQAMVGPGLAVKPTGGESDVVAPAAGQVVTLHPHAFVIAASTGGAVLVHLGIDTVKLKGEGFTLHVAKGDAVEAGQKMITWNPTEVESQGYSSTCPVIALEAAPESLTDLREDAQVLAGDPLFVLDA
ncbi:PTS glucose transporter subunit IIA [Saccharopolyspora rhizosphaerae]|uniref:PTS glucose transporter subunit IIA n=1 Tax=Saccharopolyspora rhizosphaerae TaxID=2492662 RepID=A0A426JYH2_9PSEU|nr:PTS glucose transporter subunit IIA [Saccharopolyspora rhizosphaerae]RRO18199.1 PTS glucose transporter subunit IIA [Saccharopolyspora rhizosphaerae]